MSITCHAWLTSQSPTLKSTHSAESAPYWVMPFGAKYHHLLRHFLRIVTMAADTSVFESRINDASWRAAGMDLGHLSSAPSSPCGFFAEPLWQLFLFRLQIDSPAVEISQIFARLSLFISALSPVWRIDGCNSSCSFSLSLTSPPHRLTWVELLVAMAHPW